ncbi:DUF1835 domain-containing protein [Cohnella silvisoli]|uniref:DUF1835 domain-containing protein n=1 Tax=Cohnella silvisoli TaxID=2873699 RepID=A0ABV1KQ42_9BACL|nr:DUF1835 domain-containing protein [Cohnella silvisoli]MCD9022124.1 DUF1835 domain-containing protein [Cohnella silvisoli]
MLHIVNGDSVANKLKEAAIHGDILVWREIYTEGPLFLQPRSAEHRNIRANYLERELGIPREEWVSSSEAQEKRLAKFTDYEEVVLWFEHDLFDQTMLGYLLHWFSSQTLGNTKLSLLCIGDYPGIEVFRGMGQLSVGQLSSLASKRHEVGQEELSLGKKAWEAYVSTEPRDLLSLLHEDTSALPYLHNTFQLQLNRYPSARNGLGIVEQTTLEYLLEGYDTPLQFFQRVGDKLHELGMGDLQYWLSLRRMSQGSHPLILVNNDVIFPKYSQSADDFLNTRIRLTDLGSHIVAEDQDWLSLNGIDTWFGGVHLQGNHDVWRWDRDDRKLVRI